MPALLPILTTTAVQVLTRRTDSMQGGGMRPSGEGGGGLSPAEIIAEAEEHWNVSGSSVLASWAATFVGSVSS
jgi:hypothetical protein